MPINQDEVKTAPFDNDLCESTEQKLLDILNESKLNLRELTIVLGRLMIDLGGSLGGYTEAVSINDAWRRYAENPTFTHSWMSLGADLLYHWAELRDPETTEK